MTTKEDTDIVGAPASLTLGDVTYRMSRLTDEDICELDEWVQDRVVDVAARYLKRAVGLSLAEREQFLISAMRAASCATFMSGEGAKMMGTISGLARLIWQSIRAHHPSVTILEIRKHFTDPNNVVMANAKWKFVNNVTQKKMGPLGSNPPEDKSTASSLEDTVGPPKSADG